MKKTFPLHRQDRHPDRVLDALKHELHRYMARERRRPLPPETDFWHFDCRLGLDEASAQPVHPAQLNSQLSALAQTGAKQCYVQLLALPMRRQWVAPVAAQSSSVAVPPAQLPHDPDTNAHPAA